MKKPTPADKKPKKRLGVKRRPVSELPEGDLDRARGGGSQEFGDPNYSIYTSTILDTRTTGGEV